MSGTVLHLPTNSHELLTWRMNAHWDFMCLVDKSCIPTIWKAALYNIMLLITILSCVLYAQVSNIYSIDVSCMYHVKYKSHVTYTCTTSYSTHVSLTRRETWKSIECVNEMLVKSYLCYSSFHCEYWSYLNSIQHEVRL